MNAYNSKSGLMITDVTRTLKKEPHDYLELEKKYKALYDLDQLHEVVHALRSKAKMLQSYISGKEELIEKVNHYDLKRIEEYEKKVKELQDQKMYWLNQKNTAEKEYEKIKAEYNPLVDKVGKLQEKEYYLKKSIKNLQTLKEQLVEEVIEPPRSTYYESEFVIQDDRKDCLICKLFC